MPTPRLSLVVLTWNEEENIVACLEAIGRQADRDVEVIVVDAGSTDLTAGLVEQAKGWLPFPLRLHVGPPGMPIGAARNLGVQMARAPNVAFISADAQVRPHWVEEALHTLGSADMAFGPQVHSPGRWSLGAAVRGLRYAFPDGPAEDPLQFASNVAAAYRKDVLLRFPFDPWANAAEDLLLARRAHGAGYRAAYNPAMVANHRDVSSLRQELRKNVREGRGWGLYADELGALWHVLAWGLLLALAAAMFAFGPLVGALALLVALYLPAVRRATVGLHGLAPGQTLLAVACSPPFDLAFLASYLHGTALRRLGRRPRGDAASTSDPSPEETPT